MQKIRWVVLSLLVIGCSYHKEASAMDVFIKMNEKEMDKFIEMDDKKEADEYSLLTIQNSEGDQSHPKKCSQCWKKAKYQCKASLSCEKFSHLSCNCKECCIKCWDTSCWDSSVCEAYFRCTSSPVFIAIYWLTASGVIIFSITEIILHS